MSHHRFRHLGIAFALTAALGLAAAQPGTAQPASHRAPRPVLQQPGLFERAWGWLARIWAADAGPGVDPDGARITSTPTPPVRPTIDMGPGIDPDGHS